jgi:hypothetical protein
MKRRLEQDVQRVAGGGLEMKKKKSNGVKKNGRVMANVYFVQVATNFVRRGGRLKRQTQSRNRSEILVRFTSLQFTSLY